MRDYELKRVSNRALKITFHKTTRLQKQYCLINLHVRCITRHKNVKNFPQDYRYDLYHSQKVFQVILPIDITAERTYMPSNTATIFFSTCNIITCIAIYSR